jgi:hypothetical protein
VRNHIEKQRDMARSVLPSTVRSDAASLDVIPASKLTRPHEPSCTACSTLTTPTTSTTRLIATRSP